MLRSALKLKRYALVLFEKEKVFSVVTTSSIIVGLAVPSQQVVICWDRKSPSVKAKIIKLGSKSVLLIFCFKKFYQDI